MNAEWRGFGGKTCASYVHEVMQLDKIEEAVRCDLYMYRFEVNRYVYVHSLPKASFIPIPLLANAKIRDADDVVMLFCDTRISLQLINKL